MFKIESQSGLTLGDYVAFYPRENGTEAHLEDGVYVSQQDTTEFYIVGMLPAGHQLNLAIFDNLEDRNHELVLMIKFFGGNVDGKAYKFAYPGGKSSLH